MDLRGNLLNKIFIESDSVGVLNEFLRANWRNSHISVRNQENRHDFDIIYSVTFCLYSTRLYRSK